ncbi:hypothetical protein AHAS_Ahas14G0271000 [Arachis hypogaea]
MKQTEVDLVKYVSKQNHGHKELTQTKIEKEKRSEAKKRTIEETGQISRYPLHNQRHNCNDAIAIAISQAPCSSSFTNSEHSTILPSPYSFLQIPESSTPNPCSFACLGPSHKTSFLNCPTHQFLFFPSPIYIVTINIQFCDIPFSASMELHY